MKKIFLIALAATGLFTACKKNNDNNPAPEIQGSTVAKIKTQTTGSGVKTNEYDAQGRLLKGDYSNGSKLTYEYKPGIINEKYYNSGGVLVNEYIHEINADGFIAKTTSPTNPNYQGVYAYNPDKTQAKYVSLINGTNVSIDYFYSNGNEDSSRYNTQGVWSSTSYFTYYTDKDNVLSDENTGEYFYGKKNKNLLKSYYIKYNDGTTNQTTTYTYEFDAQGRVIKKTSTSNNNIDIALYTY